MKKKNEQIWAFDTTASELVVGEIGFQRKPKESYKNWPIKNGGLTRGNKIIKLINT